MNYKKIHYSYKPGNLIKKILNIIFPLENGYRKLKQSLHVRLTTSTSQQENYI